MRHLSISNRSGFTLVEVLVAMVFMLVGLLGLLQSINISMEHNVKNHLREEATRVGEREMNVFRTNPGVTALKRISSTVLPNKSFVVTKTATPFAGSQELEVVVRWKFKNMSTQHMVRSILSN